MNDFWRWYVALCLALTAMLAAFQLRLETPQPIDAGYPVISATATELPPQWVDGCGVLRDAPFPDLAPTVIPPDRIAAVCK